TKNPLSSVLKIPGSMFQDIPQNMKAKNRLRVMKSLGDNASEYLILAGVLPVEDMKKQFAPFFEGCNFIQGLMNAELRTKLVEDLLSVDDTISMAHSLELRVPLLDNRIVDLMATVPWQMKYQSGTHGKLLLRKAIRGILPEESLRKPKWGFSVNVQAWFRGEVGELVRQILPESEVIQKYFQADRVRKLIASTTNSDRER